MMSLTVLATILGFVGPFVPELLKWLNRKQDNAHELAMLEMSAKLAEKQAGWRMEELRASGEYKLDEVALAGAYKQQESFGVQLLDAAKGWPAWIVVPVFWLFAWIDALNASVRPVITYWVVGFYLFYKYSLLKLARLQLNFHEAIIANWTENDNAVLMMCIGYFFGQRIAKAAFGGSASTGRAGGG